MLMTLQRELESDAAVLRHDKIAQLWRDGFAMGWANAIENKEPAGLDRRRPSFVMGYASGYQAGRRCLWLHANPPGRKNRQYDGLGEVPF